MNNQKFFAIYTGAKNLSVKLVLILVGSLSLYLLLTCISSWLSQHPCWRYLIYLLQHNALALLAPGCVFLVTLGALFGLLKPDQKANAIKNYLLILPTYGTQCIWVYIIISCALFYWLHSVCCVLILLLLVVLLSMWIDARNPHFLQTLPGKKTLQKDPLQEDPLKDIPLQTMQKEDPLGRNNFITTTADVISSLQGANNRLLLDGDWGSGKTSIVNCIQDLLRQQSDIQFCKVNPWSNNTREKFVTALIGEIENFCQNTTPSFSISSTLPRNLLATLDSLSFGPFSLHFPHSDCNVENNIEELSNQLKFKQQRLMIIIDDLDRLSKPQILDILSVMYLFSQCNNLIFMLVANKTKVEEILTEQKDPCYQGRGAASPICNAKYYENYLDKMISNVFRIPDIFPEALTAFLIKQLQGILATLQLPPLSDEEIECIGAINCFDNIRSVKRVLNAFYNALHQTQLKGEVNSLHFLLLTVLYIRFNSIYDRIKDEPDFWIKQEITEFTDNKLSAWKNYFDGLLALYPQEKETLQSIFHVLTPNYENLMLALQIKNKKQEDIPFRWRVFPPLHPQKAFYQKRYFYKYFKQNFSQNDVPDAILDAFVKNHADQSPSVQLAAWASLIERYKDKMPSIFNYVETTSFAQQLKDSFVMGCASVLGNIPRQLKPNQLLHLLQLLVDFLRNYRLNTNDIKKCFDEIGSTFLDYLFYETYTKNLANRADFLHTLQKNSDTVDTVFAEAKTYALSRYAKSYIYAWMREFEKPDPKAYKEHRVKEVLEQMSQHEDDFWFLLGEELFLSLGDEYTFTIPGCWTWQNIYEVTQALLKKEKLAHREEIAAIAQKFPHR